MSGGLFRTDGGNKMSSGLDLSDPEIAAGWARVRDDADADAEFLLLTYASKNKLAVAAVGTLDGMSAVMVADNVYFGGLKHSDGKFYAIYCVGDNVGGMAKARAGMHKNSVVNALDGTVGEVTGMGMEEFSESLAALG
mmetsp:Transcript_1625/g.4495  ORF Transcript_1625/g.4495 Transcript_1625/m.4495 type:complete len:138 (-) Transcript_1625:78-491(-)